MPKFEEKLSILLKSRNMTQEEAGKEFGVSQRAVCGWLAGSIPRRPILEAISKKFKIDLEVLMDSTKSLPPEYDVHKNIPAKEFEKLLDYLEIFESLGEEKLIRAINLAIKNKDLDIAEVLISRLKKRNK